MGALQPVQTFLATIALWLIATVSIARILAEAIHHA